MGWIFYISLPAELSGKLQNYEVNFIIFIKNGDKFFTGFIAIFIIFRDINNLELLSICGMDFAYKKKKYMIIFTLRN